MGVGNPNQPAGSWCLHPYSGVMGPLEQFITGFLSTQKQIFRGTESTVAIVQDQWYYNKSSASLYSCWFNVLFFLNVSCAALLLLSHFILPHPAGGGYCLGLGGVTPCSPVPSSSPRNAVHFMNGSIWIFWTKKRATLWKPTSRDRCSALCGEVPQLMSFGDRGKDAVRDIPWAWELSGPWAGFTRRHRAKLHGAELSALLKVSSRSCFETSSNRVYSDTGKDILGSFLSLFMSFDYPKDTKTWEYIFRFM